MLLAHHSLFKFKKFVLRVQTFVHTYKGAQRMGRKIQVGSDGKGKDHDEALGEITWPAEQRIKRRTLYVQFLQREEPAAMWFEYAGTSSDSQCYVGQPIRMRSVRQIATGSVSNRGHGH